LGAIFNQIASKTPENQGFPGFCILIRQTGSTSARGAALACQKSPHRTFLTALSAKHFERFQNAVTESLDIPRLSTAVYPI